MIAGALVWRAVIAGLLGLSALLPNIGLEQVLRDWNVALLAVMALATSRRAFWISLAAIALGFGLDAITPSYDAGAWWSFASLALQLLSAVALLWGLFLLGRFYAALVAAGMLLGMVARREELAIGFSVAASFVQAVGYFLISRRVRTQPSAPSANRGLLRWSIIEIVRLALVVAFLFAIDGRNEIRLLVAGLSLIFAGLTFFGLRGLARFLDQQEPLGWGTVTLVIALLPLFPVAESYFTGRADAIEYVRFTAIALGLAWIGGALSMLGFIARAAKGRLATAARYLRRAMLIDFAILLGGAGAMSFGGWDTRQTAQHVLPFFALLLVALWILYLILQVVAGVKAESFANPR